MNKLKEIEQYIENINAQNLYLITRVKELESQCIFLQKKITEFLGGENDQEKTTRVN